MTTIDKTYELIIGIRRMNQFLRTWGVDASNISHNKEAKHLYQNITDLNYPDWNIAEAELTSDSLNKEMSDSILCLLKIEVNDYRTLYQKISPEMDGYEDYLKRIELVYKFTEEYYTPKIDALSERIKELDKKEKLYTRFSIIYDTVYQSGKLSFKDKKQEKEFYSLYKEFKQIFNIQTEDVKKVWQGLDYYNKEGMELAIKRKEMANLIKGQHDYPYIMFSKWDYQVFEKLYIDLTDIQESFVEKKENAPKKGARKKRIFSSLEECFLDKGNFERADIIMRKERDCDTKRVKGLCQFLIDSGWLSPDIKNVRRLSNLIIKDYITMFKCVVEAGTIANAESPDIDYWKKRFK